MEETKKPEIQIEIDDAAAQGIYTNLAMIGHSENEFILDHFLQNFPNFFCLIIDQTSGAANIIGKFALQKTRNDKRAKEFQGHVFWQTALVEVKFRTDNDNRTS